MPTGWRYPATPPLQCLVDDKEYRLGTEKLVGLEEILRSTSDESNQLVRGPGQGYFVLVFQTRSLLNFLNRIFGLLPGPDPARMSIDVRIAKLDCPHGSIVAAAALDKPAVEDD